MMKHSDNLPVGREHARFLGAVFVATVTSHASSVVDTAVGGYLLGDNVVSAVNLVRPIEEVFYGLSLLLGMGGCTAASFAFGNRDAKQVRSHFTAAILSAATVFVSLAMFLLLMRDRVVDFLCGDSYLWDYTNRYLVSVTPWFVFGNLIGIVNQFVAMTGKPHLSMYASIAYFASNAAFDYLLVGVFGYGIGGLGCSSLISSLVGLLILLPYWLKSPLRFIHNPIRQMMRNIRSNVHYGVGLMTGEISYILFIFLMNTLTLKYLGEKGLFCWSVVVMIFLVCDFASAASQETCLSLGGRYIGAGRPDFANIVFRRSTAFTAAWTVLCAGLTLALPGHLLPLLGAADSSDHHMLVTVIALTVPVTVGLNLVTLHIARLIIENRVKRFTVLVTVLYLSVPLFFFMFHCILPGQEWWGIMALIPLQLILSILHTPKVHVPPAPPSRKTSPWHCQG